MLIIRFNLSYDVTITFKHIFGVKTSRFCHYIHNIVMEVIINVTNRAGPRGFVYWGCGGRALKAEGVNRAGRAGMGGRRE